MPVGVYIHAQMCTVVSSPGSNAVLSAVILKTSVGAAKLAKDNEHRQNRIRTDRHMRNLILTTFIISFPVLVRLHCRTRPTSMPYARHAIQRTDRTHHGAIITQRPKMSTTKLPKIVIFRVSANQPGPATAYPTPRMAGFLVQRNEFYALFAISKATAGLSLMPVCCFLSTSMLDKINAIVIIDTVNHLEFQDSYRARIAPTGSQVKRWLKKRFSWWMTTR